MVWYAQAWLKSQLQVQSLKSDAKVSVMIAKKNYKLGQDWQTKIQNSITRMQRQNTKLECNAIPVIQNLNANPEWENANPESCDNTKI